jgi:LmbE family N-acetylglucosaminyl deacetylase
MKHLFLSPHLDDAVLSCGATINQLVREGDSVTILTVTAGDPSPSTVDTPKIQDLHQRWQAGETPTAARRREDEEAARSLGAQIIHLPIGDCVYRTARKGDEIIPLYPSEESLFGDVHPDDGALEALAATSIPDADVLYVPLGVGHHVDHQITRDWGLELKNRYPSLALKLYEEYPYVNDKITIDRARSFYTPRAITVELRLLEDADVIAKVHAIACYRSQISTFWSGLDAMEQATRQSMLAAGNGTLVERYWLMEQG